MHYLFLMWAICCQCDSRAPTTAKWKKGESLSTVEDKIRTPVQFSYCILGPISGGFTLIISDLWFLLLYKSDTESLHLIYPHSVHHFLTEQSQFYWRISVSSVALFRTCQHKSTHCTEKMHDDMFVKSLETNRISTERLSKRSTGDTQRQYDRHFCFSLDLYNFLIYI